MSNKTKKLISLIVLIVQIAQLMSPAVVFAVDNLCNVTLNCVTPQDWESGWFAARESENQNVTPQQTEYTTSGDLIRNAGEDNSVDRRDNVADVVPAIESIGPGDGRCDFCGGSSQGQCDGNPGGRSFSCNPGCDGGLKFCSDTSSCLQQCPSDIPPTPTPTPVPTAAPTRPAPTVEPRSTVVPTSIPVAQPTSAKTVTNRPLPQQPDISEAIETALETPQEDEWDERELRRERYRQTRPTPAATSDPRRCDLAGGDMRGGVCVLPTRTQTPAYEDNETRRTYVAYPSPTPIPSVSAPASQQPGRSDVALREQSASPTLKPTPTSGKPEICRPGIPILPDGTCADDVLTVPMPTNRPGGVVEFSPNLDGEVEIRRGSKGQEEEIVVTPTTVVRSEKVTGNIQIQSYCDGDTLIKKATQGTRAGVATSVTSEVCQWGCKAGSCTPATIQQAQEYRYALLNNALDQAAVRCQQQGSSQCAPQDVQAEALANMDAAELSLEQVKIRNAELEDTQREALVDAAYQQLLRENRMRTAGGSRFMAIGSFGNIDLSPSEEKQAELRQEAEQQVDETLKTYQLNEGGLNNLTADSDVWEKIANLSKEEAEKLVNQQAIIEHRGILPYSGKAIAHWMMCGLNENYNWNKMNPACGLQIFSPEAIRSYWTTMIAGKSEQAIWDQGMIIGDPRSPGFQTMDYNINVAPRCGVESWESNLTEEETACLTGQNVATKFRLAEVDEQNMANAVLNVTSAAAAFVGGAALSGVKATTTAGKVITFAFREGLASDVAFTPLFAEAMTAGDRTAAETLEVLAASAPPGSKQEQVWSQQAQEAGVAVDIAYRENVLFGAAAATVMNVAPAQLGKAVGNELSETALGKLLFGDTRGAAARQVAGEAADQLNQRVVGPDNTAYVAAVQAVDRTVISNGEVKVVRRGSDGSIDTVSGTPQQLSGELSKLRGGDVVLHTSADGSSRRMYNADSNGRLHEVNEVGVDDAGQSVIGNRQMNIEDAQHLAARTTTPDEVLVAADKTKQALVGGSAAALGERAVVDTQLISGTEGVPKAVRTATEMASENSGVLGSVRSALDNLRTWVDELRSPKPEEAGGARPNSDLLNAVREQIDGRRAVDETTAPPAGRAANTDQVAGEPLVDTQRSEGEAAGGGGPVSGVVTRIGDGLAVVGRATADAGQAVGRAATNVLDTTRRSVAGAVESTLDRLLDVNFGRIDDGLPTPDRTVSTIRVTGEEVTPGGRTSAPVVGKVIELNTPDDRLMFYYTADPVNGYLFILPNTSQADFYAKLADFASEMVTQNGRDLRLEVTGPERTVTTYRLNTVNDVSPVIDTTRTELEGRAPGPEAARDAAPESAADAAAGQSAAEPAGPADSTTNRGAFSGINDAYNSWRSAREAASSARIEANRSKEIAESVARDIVAIAREDFTAAASGTKFTSAQEAETELQKLASQIFEDRTGQNADRTTWVYDEALLRVQESYPGLSGNEWYALARQAEDIINNSRADILRALTDSLNVAEQVKPGKTTVAIGDVHGDWEEFVKLASGQSAAENGARVNTPLVDKRGKWIGGENDTLWLTGDLVDRAPQGTSAIPAARNVMNLQNQAGVNPQAGKPRVRVLLGNHDANALFAYRQLIDLLRQGVPLEKAAKSAAITNIRPGITPAELIDLYRDRELVEWMSNLDAIAVEDGNLYVHSDTRNYLMYGRGVDEINQNIKNILRNGQATVTQHDGSKVVKSLEELVSDLTKRREFSSATVDEFLRQFNADHIYHGHTQGGTPVDSRVTNIDGGLSRSYQSAGHKPRFAESKSPSTTSVNVDLAPVRQGVNIINSSTGESTGLLGRVKDAIEEIVGINQPIVIVSPAAVKANNIVNDILGRFGRGSSLDDMVGPQRAINMDTSLDEVMVSGSVAQAILDQPGLGYTSKLKNFLDEEPVKFALDADGNRIPATPEDADKLRRASLRGLQPDEIPAKIVTHEGQKDAQNLGDVLGCEVKLQSSHLVPQAHAAGMACAPRPTGRTIMRSDGTSEVFGTTDNVGRGGFGTVERIRTGEVAKTALDRERASYLKAEVDLLRNMEQQGFGDIFPQVTGEIFDEGGDFVGFSMTEIRPAVSLSKWPYSVPESIVGPFMQRLTDMDTSGLLHRDIFAGNIMVTLQPDISAPSGFRPAGLMLIDPFKPVSGTVSHLVDMNELYGEAYSNSTAYAVRQSGDGNTARVIVPEGNVDAATAAIDHHNFIVNDPKYSRNPRFLSDGDLRGIAQADLPPGYKERPDGLTTSDRDRTGSTTRDTPATSEGNGLFGRAKNWINSIMEGQNAPLGAVESSARSAYNAIDNLRARFGRGSSLDNFVGPAGAVYHGVPLSDVSVPDSMLTTINSYSGRSTADKVVNYLSDKPVVLVRGEDGWLRPATADDAAKLRTASKYGLSPDEVTARVDGVDANLNQAITRNSQLEVVSTEKDIVVSEYEVVIPTLTSDDLSNIYTPPGYNGPIITGEDFREVIKPPISPDDPPIFSTIYANTLADDQEALALLRKVFKLADSRRIGFDSELYGGIYVDDDILERILREKGMQPDYESLGVARRDFVRQNYEIPARELLYEDFPEIAREQKGHPNPIVQQRAEVISSLLTYWLNESRIAADSSFVENVYSRVRRNSQDIYTNIVYGTSIPPRVNTEILGEALIQNGLIDFDDPRAFDVLEQYLAFEPTRYTTARSNGSTRTTATVLVKENINLDRALTYAGRLAQSGQPITINSIRKTQYLLTEGLKKDAGYIRAIEVNIGDTPFRLVGDKLNNWANELSSVAVAAGRGELTGDDLYRKVAELHYDYVRIHPFTDGNGRSARILSNIPLARAGQPLFYIPVGTKDIYTRYLSNLDKLDRSSPEFEQELNLFAMFLRRNSKYSSFEEIASDAITPLVREDIDSYGAAQVVVKTNTETNVDINVKEENGEKGFMNKLRDLFNRIVPSQNKSSQSKIFRTQQVYASENLLPRAVPLALYRTLGSQLLTTEALRDLPEEERTAEKLAETIIQTSALMRSLPERGVLVSSETTVAGTTGTSGTAAGNVAKGTYTLAVDPVAGVDMIVPQMIDVGLTSTNAVLIGVVEGKGRVKIAGQKSAWQRLFWGVGEWVVRKFAPEVGAVENGDRSLQQVETRAASKIPLTVQLFHDANKNGEMDAGERPVEWAGVGISLTPTTQTVKYELVDGWNLVSFPVNPSSISTAAQLAQDVALDGGYVTTVATWDGDRWMEYSQRGAEKFGHDFPIEPGRAYFLRSHLESVWTVAGTPLPEEGLTLALKKGWNAIGVPADGYTAVSAIDTVQLPDGPLETSDQIARWFPGSWDVVVKRRYRPDHHEVYGEDFTIKQNEGYFLHLKQDVNWLLE